MGDPDIARWNNLGSISLWHYDGFPANFPGYHMMADERGCLFLIGLIERFRSSQYPARKTVPLTKPSAEQLAVPNCGRKCQLARELELRYRRELEDRHWVLSESDGKVTIELGLDGLRQIDRGATDMMQAKGDWSTGEGDGSLWFWWHPHTPLAEQFARGNKPRG